MHQTADFDPDQTREWLDSLAAVIEVDGPERARELLARLLDEARRLGDAPVIAPTTPYVNTIAPEREPDYPGDEELEHRIENINRWNAAVMVTRANKRFDGIGGHISTYASQATLVEVAFNHFFRGQDEGPGDQIWFQGHASPGLYARAFLEGRLEEDQLDRFRREAARDGRGLSSYPHPRLMPEFWEFPSVSMGLGPISAIYQARYNRYLHARGLVDTSNSRVWCFVGDGESDEPETRGALHIAAREGLDNLIFVVNCNLQRLDGPVRGNHKIVQELEGSFRGSGWNVLKVLWSRDWDELFAKDEEHALRDALGEVVDGDWQRFAAQPGEKTREEFFGQDPRIAKIVEHLSDEEIRDLRRGAHDPRKVFAAYDAATRHEGRPTVILALSVKGYGIEDFAGKNSTHQMKKMSGEQLQSFRDQLELPIKDADLEDFPYYHPGEDSEEARYARERRKELSGFVPTRRHPAPKDLEQPKAEVWKKFLEGAKGEFSTTMAFAQMLAGLLKDEKVGKRIVPIIPDEARTFGMEALFRQVGIYAPGGQRYEPIDKSTLLYYKESADGQLLEEGITEAGSMASFTAAGTSHVTFGEPTIPFYVFYSMFGHQRTGDQVWAFGDMRGRGFLMAATAGRTTLNGEGLQHEDGHSHVLISTVPNVRAYDPAFAFELAVILEDGLRRMYGEGEDCFYYVTIQNENYAMPAMPEGAEEGIVKGLYRFREASEEHDLEVQLFGSACILQQALEAQKILSERFEVSAHVWSATSYQLLRKEALECERWNRLHPNEEPRIPYVESVLEDVDTPIVAATDYMKLVADQIAPWVPSPFVTLGTDGFGMSDTREELRRHFEVDAKSIVVAALSGLHAQGAIEAEEVQEAIEELGVDPDKIDPLHV